MIYNPRDDRRVSFKISECPRTPDAEEDVPSLAVTLGRIAAGFVIVMVLLLCAVASMSLLSFAIRAFRMLISAING